MNCSFDQLLRDCQDVFETVGDIPLLRRVYGACADLEDQRVHRQDAVECARTALRLTYVHPHPRGIAVLHYNLANYLSRIDAAILTATLDRLPTTPGQDP